MPIRVQLSRKKGWKMPPNTVKVARPSLWGNPYRIDDSVGMTRERCLTLYRETVLGCWSPSHIEDLTDEVAEKVYAAHCAFVKSRLGEWLHADLRGKDLACWCKPDEPCHADILLELANP